MSSAKSAVELEGRTAGRSFIKAEKRVGSRVEPCGTPLVGKQREEYSQTSLVSTPGDPPNCYSLSVVLANHID